MGINIGTFFKKFNWESSWVLKNGVILIEKLKF
jgi:hypothetical protein